MWFATRAGLNRFDGYDFVQFKSRVDNKNYLSDSSIECLYEDQNGNLWIGTKSGGLNFYDAQKETFQHITTFGQQQQTLTDITITSIAGATNGNIFVGTRSNGLYILNFESDSVSYLFEDCHITDIVFDGENLAWIGTSNGVYKLNMTTFKPEHLFFGEYSHITEILLHLWITGWSGGLIRLNKQTQTWERYSLNKNDDSYRTSSNQTYSILLNSSNQLFVGTWGDGIYNFDRENKVFRKINIEPKPYGRNNSDYQVILDIFEDRDNNIWIGVDGGGLVLISGWYFLSTIMDDYSRYIISWELCKNIRFCK